MNIINKPVTLTINGKSVEFLASGNRTDAGEIKLTTLTHQSENKYYLDGCAWLLDIPQVYASIVEQVDTNEPN